MEKSDKLRVLWVYEETRLLPWISMTFSVALMLNFAFLPRKLMVSHGQGLCSLCLAFVVFCQHSCSRHYKVLLTMWTVTSPLSLRRDSFITLDLNDFFSSTNAELCLSPTKIDRFPWSGFQGLNPFVVFHQHFVVHNTRFYWPFELSGDGVDSCSKCVGSK